MIANRDNHGGVSDIYLINADELSAALMLYGDLWAYPNITEDAEFEIIEPKQLPAPNAEATDL